MVRRNEVFCINQSLNWQDKMLWDKDRGTGWWMQQKVQFNCTCKVGWWMYIDCYGQHTVLLKCRRHYKNKFNTTLFVHLLSRLWHSVVNIFQSPNLILHFCRKEKVLFCVIFLEVIYDVIGRVMDSFFGWKSHLPIWDLPT